MISQLQTGMPTGAKALLNSRGVATSLLETTLVIAIVAIVSGVAMVSGMDRVEDAKYARAHADVEMIGIAVHSFMHDTGYAPAFKSGAARSPADPIFLVLESAGTEPSIADSLNWPADAEQRDRIEHHLISNRPSGAGPRYPRIGETSYARMKGWNGPYLASIPSSDPWDNKYLINVQLLTPKGVAMASEALELGPGQRTAVIVISAGPNRQIDTKFDQIADSFTAGGDDILFRLQ